jgi:nicotinate-nucleotide adenylyltransferase
VVVLKLGILGGTFNPIHFGHLRTAEEIGEELGLEKVFLIPSAFPPHKTKDPVTPFHHRLTMARLAVGDSPLLDVLDLEGKRRGLSYSIETLKEFHVMFSPDPELFFVVGTDAFLEIDTWKGYMELFDYAHFVIVQRPGYNAGELEPFLSDIGLEVKKAKMPNVFITPSGKTLIPMAPTFMEISSTHIRRRVSAGKSIRFLVPESVRAYITEKGLFSKHAVH